MTLGSVEAHCFPQLLNRRRGSDRLGPLRPA
jgi:hypothetical protein